MDSNDVSVIETSQWPLPRDGRRIVVPQALIQTLGAHPLCGDCLPHGVGYYPRAAGHQMGRASPRDHLLIYCVAGRGEVDLGGDTHPVGPGDVLLFREGQPHRYRARPDDPWTIYWVHLGGAAVDAFFDAIEPDPRAGLVPVGLHSRLSEEFEVLLATAVSFQIHHQVHAANVLRGLLTFLALVRRRQQARQAALDVDRVQSYLQSRLHERLALDDLVAATSTLSRYHFIREYKRLTGQTPMQAFQHLKISRACYLLDVSDLGVSDIARHLGHDDPYYFSRLFKKVMGVAPRHYRRERSSH